MGEMAVKAASGWATRAPAPWSSSSDGEFYFMEANTRVQVEHPVTEMVTGIDIVKEQIRIAAGLPLSVQAGGRHAQRLGHRVPHQRRRPAQRLRPVPRQAPGLPLAGRHGRQGGQRGPHRYTIPPIYDPMISKLIVWGRDRNEAIARMKRALYEYIIVGVKTNIPFHKAVMDNPRFVRGELGTHFIEQETGLSVETRRIAEQAQNLGEKLSHLGHDRRKIAAIAAVAAMVRD